MLVRSEISECVTDRKADHIVLHYISNALYMVKKRKKTFDNRLELKISYPSALPKQMRVSDFKFWQIKVCIYI